MARDELRQLRALVRKRRAAVTAKEGRIARTTGVDLRNTAADPRRPPKVVDRYTRPQLNAYLNELNRFMERGNNFYSGAGNTPIPKTKWQEYKRLEQKYNSIGATHFDKIADIFIPGSGMTIAQRDRLMRPDNVRAQGAIVNRPYSQIERTPANVNGEKALDKLIKSMRAKLDAGFLPAQIKEARKQLSQMLTAIGNPELISRAKNLSDSQFDTLWNYTKFATNISGTYFIMQSKNVDSSDRWYSTVVEDYSADISELLGWAASLPTSANKARTGRKR